MHNIRPKLKLFKSYEKAQEEVEKLKQQLYPNLGSENEGGGDGKTLNTIIENESDYTSEAVAESDDEVRRSEVDEYGDDILDEEEENSQMDDPKSEENKVPEKSEEDLAFEAMFEKMSVDSYQERIKEVPKISTRDIPLPMSTKTIKKTYEQLQETDDKPTDSVPFVLMVRNTKSGKQQFKSFAAPSDSELAVNLKVQEQKVKEEHEKVKRLTLNITERLEEEDYQESLQRSPAQNRFRPKVQKFKHQKGVPDIDF
jgi:regulator of nonsense transcripts 2